jgi:hypothetical protein
MPRILLAALLALALAGCGGRTGLGVWIDGGGPPQDASLPDGYIPDGGGDALGDGGPTDGGGRQDAATGKNCAQVMMCAFDSLSSGFDWQALLACTQGSTGSGLTQSGQLILCLAQNCASMLMGDGGGQMDILFCLIQNCKTEICNCDGIGDIIPPGIITCP